MTAFHKHLIEDFDKNIDDYASCPEFCTAFRRVCDMCLTSSLHNVCIVSSVLDVDTAIFYKKYNDTTESGSVIALKGTQDEQNRSEIEFIELSSGKTYKTSVQEQMYRDLMFEIKAYSSSIN